MANQQTVSIGNSRITVGGTYTIEQGFSGTITINTTEPVTLDGAEAGELSDVKIITYFENADLTIKDLKVASTLEANLIKFGTGTDNKLTVLGNNVLSNSKSQEKAGINVGGGLTIDVLRAADIIKL